MTRIETGCVIRIALIRLLSVDSVKYTVSAGSVNYTIVFGLISSGFKILNLIKSTENLAIYCAVAQSERLFNFLSGTFGTRSRAGGKGKERRTERLPGVRFVIYDFLAIKTL